jgi:photosystem II stability/assembly factor-like uncharacterized protein
MALRGTKVLLVLAALAAPGYACPGMNQGACGTGSGYSWRQAQVSTSDTWQPPTSVIGISRYNSDCHPSVTRDGHRMAFCAAVQNGPPYDTLHIGTGFNVYHAVWNGVTWDSVKNVGRHINPATYPTISPGGETLFFVKASKLWMSFWEDTGWSNPVRLPSPVNDSNNQVYDGPCAVRWDGRQLYFKSTRTGGYGSGDIWVVRVTSSGFDSLTNLGPNVNSSGMETHPAISPDAQRLYFSDFGGIRPGWKFGDCDLFVSHWTGTEWGPAEILPAPVNTDLPCCSAFETPDGKLYLGSEVSEGTAGEEDVWVTTRTASHKGRAASTGTDGWVNTADLPGAKYVYRLAEHGGAIYAATGPNGDVFKTTDGGNSWQNTAELSGAMNVYSLLSLPDGSLLGGTYPDGKVFKTTNAGASWQEIAQFGYAHGVRCLLRKSDGTLFAGTSPDSWQTGRIWRSTNNGSAWQKTGDAPLTAGGVFCMTEVTGGLLAGGRVTGDRFFVSLNNGNTWNPQDLPYENSRVTIGHLYFFYRTSDNRLWTGGWLHGPQGVLLHSTNNGIVWDTVGEIPNGAMIVARVFDMVEASDGSYFIAFHPGPDSVVFRSTDQGRTWRQCGLLSGAYEGLCLLKASDGAIFCGTSPNGDVFKYAPTAIGEPRTDLSQPTLEVEPNPCGEQARISFCLPGSMPVQLAVYDVSGRLVNMLRNARLPAGSDVNTWNSLGRPVGIYFCRLALGGRCLTRMLRKVRG